MVVVSSRARWLSFHRRLGDCRCGRGCEPSCLRVCRRWALLVFSGPTHGICVVVVQSLALGWIRWRWSSLGESIGPPPCRLDPPPPSRARVTCHPPARLAPAPPSRACVACPPPGRLAPPPSPPPCRLALRLLALPASSSLSRPFSSSSSSSCSSHPSSLLPDPSSVLPLLLVVVVVSPSGFARRQCRRLRPFVIWVSRSSSLPDPTSIGTNPLTSL